jgi:CelD/BcsL family acetyltransferase involved in cellulose biosynthesis
VKGATQHIGFEVRPPADLTEACVATWLRLAAQPGFSSPFFTPGYTRLVASCVDGVQVGIMRQGRNVVGIFPFELEAPRRARPVGSVFCDYQGVVASPDLSWQPEALLDGVGLDAWRFDHVLANQPQWERFHRVRDVSWSIDLSHGFEAYEAYLRRARRGPLQDVRRKMRMIEREAGPLSFSPHERNHQLVDTMLEWKSAQWARSGWAGRFTSAWEHRLMHRLLDTDEPTFGGMFTILRCADRPIAMHLGLRSDRLWHYWTTVYDPEFARYSPGLIMLAEMVRHAGRLGLRELDLGKEDFEYKRRFHTHTIPLAEGVAVGGGGEETGR